MVQLQAQQLIYTRVEATYSPKQFSGFQVYYASAGLSPTHIETIKSCVECFRPGDEPVTRRQFFTLPNGHFVLTQTVVISKVSEILDQERPGVFLVHALIFSSQALALVLNNPFKIFDDYPFIDSPAEMVREYNQVEGRERTAIFNLDPYSALDIEPAWLPGAPNLLELSYSARRLSQHRRSVLMLGTPQTIESLLKAIFQLTPPGLRPYCTFDTFVDCCKVESGKYWAVGATSSLDESLIPINTATYSIQSNLGSLPSPDWYVAWILQNAKGNPNQLLSNITSIQILSESFAAGQPPTWESLQPHACEAFYQLHQRAIDERFSQCLVKTLSAHLGTSLAIALRDRGIPLHEVLTLAATQKVDLRLLAKHIRHWLREKAPSFTELQKADWKTLAILARQADDPILLFWSGSQLDDQKLREQALAAMSPEAYQEALEFLLNPIDPADYVSLAHLSQLIETASLALHKMNGKAFISLTETVLKADGASHLGQLSHYILQLENDRLVQLEKLAKRYPRLPANWQQAIGERRAQLGPATLLGRIFS
jgi:hypothetical protein